ncbi:MAG: hypothetical protein MK105_00435 [Crocinitomicaceae bacterium]|nr:hypothetical protein [Crocinitomicaceae bacterium]
MKFQLILVITILLLASCLKDKVASHEPQAYYSVEYTDWSNTTVSDSLLLDLNNDGVADLRLKLYDYIAGETETGVFWNQLASIMSINDNFSFSFGTEHAQNDFDCLKMNDLINNDITWYGNGVQYNFHTNIFTGQYLNIGVWDLFNHDNHIGYRQKLGDSYHYGWIELNTSWSEIIVVQSAVNNNPHQEIPTGYIN